LLACRIGHLVPIWQPWILISSTSRVSRCRADDVKAELARMQSADEAREANQRRQLEVGPALGILDPVGCVGTRGICLSSRGMRCYPWHLLALEAWTPGGSRPPLALLVLPGDNPKPQP
jgi:hypothetical protein